MTTSMADIWNYRLGDLTESESDESNDEFATKDRQCTCTEPQNEFFFIGKRKGPRHEGLTVTKPSDPTSDRPMNYQYFRLQNSSYMLLAKESWKIREQVKTFHDVFKNTNYIGEDQSMVSDFLTTFVEKANTLCVSKAHDSWYYEHCSRVKRKGNCGRSATVPDLVV